MPFFFNWSYSSFNRRLDVFFTYKSPKPHWLLSARQSSARWHFTALNSPLCILSDTQTTSCCRLLALLELFCPTARRRNHGLKVSGFEIISHNSDWSVEVIFSSAVCVQLDSATTLIAPSQGRTIHKSSALSCFDGWGEVCPHPRNVSLDNISYEAEIWPWREKRRRQTFWFGQLMSG